MFLIELFSDWTMKVLFNNYGFMCKIQILYLVSLSKVTKILYYFNKITINNYIRTFFFKFEQ